MKKILEKVKPGEKFRLEPGGVAYMKNSNRVVIASPMDDGGYPAYLCKIVYSGRPVHLSIEEEVFVDEVGSSSVKPRVVLLKK